MKAFSLALASVLGGCGGIGVAPVAHPTAEMAAILDTSNEGHHRYVSRAACAETKDHCRNGMPFMLLVEGEEIPSITFARNVPKSVKIANFSFGGYSYPTLCNSSWNSLPYVVIQATGNTDDANWWDRFSTDNVGVINDCRDYWIKRLIDNDRLLLVSGYYNDYQGNSLQNPLNTGCGGVEEACVYVKSVYIRQALGSLDEYEYGDGTSRLAPKVFMSLVSVLAVNPSLSGPDLIRLAKECADKIPGLPGLGTINRDCMLERAA